MPKCPEPDFLTAEYFAYFRQGRIFFVKRGRCVRKIWFGQSECRGAAVRDYLVAEELAGVERYGIQVCYGDETETVADITSSQRQIQSLLDALTRGGVTPAAVRDVVEDWLNGPER